MTGMPLKASAAYEPDAASCSAADRRTSSPTSLSEAMARQAWAAACGWPTIPTPWNTVSTKLGLAFVANLALKTWLQCGPHYGVAGS